jgi:hypothetical protein
MDAGADINALTDDVADAAGLPILKITSFAGYI